MLCDEGVLDALGDSPQLSFTSKRARARVNQATRQGIFKHLRGDHVWVHLCVCGGGGGSWAVGHGTAPLRTVLQFYSLVQGNQ